MKVKEILKITGGRLISGNPESEISPSKISTDSRMIKKSEFFLALKGPNFDGNNFVNGAFNKGALGAIITGSGFRRSEFICNKGRIIIAVGDTTKALQDIARFHRMGFKIPVIGVTGSSGKTTIKEMIWTALSGKYKVLKNEGTKNNHIGVPQTLLKLDRSYDMCVVELGTNHPGEIRLLGRILRPTMALIANIGPSHLEFLQDLEGVFNAKKEIMEYLEKSAPLILNGDDPLLCRIKTKQFDIAKFGFNDGNDFRATGLSVKKGGVKFFVNDKYRFELKVPGVHNVLNALAAIAAASRLKIPYLLMRDALRDYKPEPMRLNIEKVKGVDIINDTYNSNPASMKCALDTLKNYPAGNRWVVCGDMLELGERAVYFHKMIGRMAAELGIKGLFTFGSLSRHTHSQARRSGMSRENLWHCGTHDEISGMLANVIKRGDAVLIKGSRGMRMEEVMNKFKSVGNRRPVSGDRG